MVVLYAHQPADNLAPAPSNNANVESNSRDIFDGGLA